MNHLEVKPRGFVSSADKITLTAFHEVSFTTLSYSGAVDWASALVIVEFIFFRQLGMSHHSAHERSIIFCLADSICSLRDGRSSLERSADDDPPISLDADLIVSVSKRDRFGFTISGIIRARAKQDCFQRRNIYRLH